MLAVCLRSAELVCGGGQAVPPLLLDSIHSNTNMGIGNMLAGENDTCSAAAEFRAVQAASRAQDRPAARDARAFFNSSKNRYRDVVPSDSARVRLSSRNGEMGSDYINASMIEYPNDAQRYIAAQAPLPSTMEDFWRMVWEQESGVIVMLTNNVERNRIKAHPYIPSREGESVKYGAATVSLMRSTSFHGMNVRSVRLHMEDTERGARSALTSSFNSYFGGPNAGPSASRAGAPLKSSVSRSPPSRGRRRARLIYHIQYCAWPDFGVPDRTQGVQEALKLMHTCLRGSAEKGLCGPPVVHCSAGIGRTGTFISADIAQRLIAEKQTFSIPSIVRWLRQQRYGMVQTEDQYVFIYRLLHDWLSTRLGGSNSPAPALALAPVAAEEHEAVERTHPDGCGMAHAAEQRCASTPARASSFPASASSSASFSSSTSFSSSFSSASFSSSSSSLSSSSFSCSSSSFSTSSSSLSSSSDESEELGMSGRGRVRGFGLGQRFSLSGLGIAPKHATTSEELPLATMDVQSPDEAAASPPDDLTLNEMVVCT